jgi:hypothetical protein
VGLVGVPRSSNSKYLQLQTSPCAVIEPKRHSGEATNPTTTAPKRQEPPLPPSLVIVLSTTKSTGHFRAKVELTDEVLVPNSRQPLFDAARASRKKATIQARCP